MPVRAGLGGARRARITLELSVGSPRRTDGGTDGNEQTRVASGRRRGAPTRPKRTRRRPPKRSRSGTRSSPTTWTRSSTRSTRCSRRTPRSSSAPTSKRAASSRSRPRRHGWPAWFALGRTNQLQQRSQRTVVSAQEQQTRQRGGGVGEFFDGTAGQPAAFMTARVPSFTDFLAGYAPDLLPARIPRPGSPRRRRRRQRGDQEPAARHHDRGRGLRARRGDGGRPPGDRGEHDLQAGRGQGVPQRRVLRDGDRRRVAIGLEFVRLFQVELEHYEKMEGRSLSLEGKAHRLAKMVRDNLGGAMQGLAVVPLFAGYDEDSGLGRIFSYDVAGGPYEEHRYHSIGSGSIFAKSALKKLYRDDMSDLRRGALLRAGALRRGRRRLGHRRPRPHPAALPGDRHDHRRRLPPAATCHASAVQATRKTA